MRGLIVLILMVGVWLGWIVRSAHIQRDAVAVITNAGGNVAYDWEWSNGNSVVGSNARAPKWLVNLIGVDYFGHVTRVRVLGLWTGTDIVSAHVGRLTQLEKLSMVASALSDTDLAHLKGLTNLTSLELIHSDSLTDSGLPHMKALTNLSELDLSGNKVTGTGLEHLRGLTKLSVLSLRNTEVTDAGLAHLKGLVNLSRLDLGDDLISDSGLLHLHKLTKLSHLDLSRTLVSDAGLVHLKGLTRLSYLNVNSTRVTDAGEIKLKKARPNLRIIR